MPQHNVAWYQIQSESVVQQKKPEIDLEQIPLPGARNWTAIRVKRSMPRLAIHEASKKWTMPVRNWKSAINRFMIQFEDRLANYV
jgi:hypothetical protein